MVYPSLLIFYPDLVRWVLNIEHCPMDGFFEKETRSFTIDASTELHALPKRQSPLLWSLGTRIHLAGWRPPDRAKPNQRRLLRLHPTRRETVKPPQAGDTLDLHANALASGAPSSVVRALLHSSRRAGWRSDLHPLGTSKHPPPLTSVIPLGCASFNSARLASSASIMHRRGESTPSPAHYRRRCVPRHWSEGRVALYALTSPCWARSCLSCQQGFVPARSTGLVCPSSPF